jgi:phosphatidate cytidylyltransferase
MLVQRMLAAIILLPITILLIVIGGWPYALLILTCLTIAAWEYWRMFHQSGCDPSAAVIIGGVFALILARAVYGFAGSDAMLAFLVLISMAVHVLRFERGQSQAGTGFVIDLGGILYLGWLGGYMISLRDLPDGKWLMMLTLPAVWLADSAAFFIGRRFGRHKIAPRVSPAKSWEGYLAGVIFAIPATGLLAVVWRLAGSDITFSQGMLLGLVLAAVTPLGDFGESMIKRQLGVKDSSRIIPGHGGMMDRIDSWLWAVVISYYLFYWFL